MKNSTIIVTNDLVGHEHRIEFNGSEFDEELFGEWVEENLDENGVYEFDGEIDDDLYLIQIPDEDVDWKHNFDIIIQKLEKELLNK